MYDDADFAPVLGNARLPLGIGEGARENRKSPGSVFEAISKGIGALSHR
jgi:hypothetical protein